jgi:hypothetical protein
MRTLVSVVMAMAISLGVVSAEAPPSGVSAEAPLTDFFVAVDNLETFTTGTFAGLPNPNFGRLTLLVAHRSPDDPEDNHFHAIGAVSYASLEGGGQKIIETSTNNRIPEIHTGQLPLQLLPRSLLDQRANGNGFFITHPTDTEYSHLKIDPGVEGVRPDFAGGFVVPQLGWPLDGAVGWCNRGTATYISYSWSAYSQRSGQGNLV